MPDLPTFAAAFTAFALGFLVRHAIPEYRIAHWRLWIGRRTPHRCSQCGSWHQMRHLKGERLTTGVWILLCPACRAKAFTPFEDAARGKKGDK